MWAGNENKARSRDGDLQTHPAAFVQASGASRPRKLSRLAPPVAATCPVRGPVHRPRSKTDPAVLRRPISPRPPHATHPTMKDGRPSLTANLVASVRALHNEMPASSRLFEDAIASELVPRWLAAPAARVRRAPGTAHVVERAARAVSLGLVEHVALRTRAIDDALRASLPHAWRTAGGASWARTSTAAPSGCPSSPTSRCSRWTIRRRTRSRSSASRGGLPLDARASRASRRVAASSAIGSPASSPRPDTIRRPAFFIWEGVTVLPWNRGDLGDRLRARRPRAPGQPRRGDVFDAFSITRARAGSCPPRAASPPPSASRSAATSRPTCSTPSSSWATGFGFVSGRRHGDLERALPGGRGAAPLVGAARDRRAHGSSADDFTPGRGVLGSGPK